MRVLTLAIMGLILTACGSGQSPSFSVEERKEALPQEETQKSDDALAQTSNTNNNSTRSVANFGDKKKEEKSSSEQPTVEEVIASCENGQKLEMTQVIVFAAQTNGCEWGSLQNGTEVLSAKGNLSEKNGWIRAIEEKTKSIDVPDDSIVCGIDLQSQTDEIHFDDFFAMRLNNYVAAASKVLTNALDVDADGHYLWNWSKIRGDGSEETGTRMTSLGKYCGTGACDLPGTDTPGAFNVKMNLSESNIGALMNAKLFAKLSNQSKIDFTMTATGDNIDLNRFPGECYHSGGTFDFKLHYVKKTKS